MDINQLVQLFWDAIRSR